MTDENPHTELLKKILRKRPGYAYVLPDGTAMAALAGPELDSVIIITAPTGVSFNEMTDDEINKMIVDTLEK